MGFGCAIKHCTMTHIKVALSQCVGIIDLVSVAQQSYTTKCPEGGILLGGAFERDDKDEETISSSTVLIARAKVRALGSIQVLAGAHLIGL